jgi:hypothetical protein
MDDAELRRRFEDCSLPGELWTHRAHVRVSYCYLKQYPFHEALDRLRSSIRTYNASRNVPEGPTSGYNETTTVAFLRLIDATMRSYGELLPTVNADAFCDTHPHLLQTSVLRLFYSPARRQHADAKWTFVEPDLAALPAEPARRLC